MRIPQQVAILVPALLLALAGCGDNSSSKPAPPSAAESSATPSTPAPTTPPKTVVGTGGGKPQIGMIPRGDGAAYWKAVHAGALKALAEGRKGPDGKPVVELLWQEPTKTGAQVESAKEMMGKGVAAIVIAPEDDAALTGVVAAAGRVPVVAIDTEIAANGARSVIGPSKAALEKQSVIFKGPVKIAGLEVSQGDIAKLKAGEIAALEVADAMEVGALAVRTASDCMKEKKVEKRIEVPWHILTKENADSPEMAAVVNPPVEKYLKE